MARTAIKLYLHKNSGDIYGFDDDQDHLISKDFRPLTNEEEKRHLNPPISKEQYILEAESKKQSLSGEAESEITILERKVRLNMATGTDRGLLTQWEIYSVKIADVDTSLAPDIEWPEKP